MWPGGIRGGYHGNEPLDLKKGKEHYITLQCDHAMPAFTALFFVLSDDYERRVIFSGLSVL